MTQYIYPILCQSLSTNMISEPDLSAALTLGVVIPLPATDAEALKQRLNALIVAVEAAEKKAATARHHVLAACQLLDEEQATAKKLVPGSTSFSITETTTAYSLYVNTIVANLHIQGDTMMEEIHMDTSGSAAAPTAFYSNKTLSTPLSPPGKNNGSGPGNSNDSNNSRHRNINHCNDGSGSKNSDNGGNRCGNTSSNTTVVSHGATTNDGRGPSPWPTSVNPSQGHITMYHDPSPTGQQRS
jgi:hypothetical protein